MIGVTPMIGVNDVSTEIFTPADALSLASFAAQKNINLLSYWAMQRDQVGTGSVDDYSKENTTDFQYFKDFSQQGTSSSSSSSSSSKSSSSSSSSKSSSSSSSSTSSKSSSSSSSSTSGGTTVTSSNGFVNSAITAQTGTFTATFDATPSVSPANDTLGFSNGAQTAYTGVAATVRFNTTGTIDARNGGDYAAVTSVAFAAGKTYHFRMVINVAAKTYSAYVTAPGGSEQTIASNYAFRTEQAGISSINNFNVDVNATPGGSLNYTTPVITGSTSSSSSSSSSKSSSSSSSSSKSSSSSSSSSSSKSSSSSSSSSSGTTVTSSNGFVNSPIATQSGTFTVAFDATPSISPANDTLSFSSGAQSAYTGLAATVRFNTTGTIDARNGGAYVAATNIPFSANSTYHFRLVINVAAKTYSAYVTAPGGSEQTIGSNYAFRTEQAGVSSLNNFNVDVNATPGGSLRYTAPVIQ